MAATRRELKEVRILNKKGNVRRHAKKIKFSENFKLLAMPEREITVSIQIDDSNNVNGETISNAQAEDICQKVFVTFAAPIFRNLNKNNLPTDSVVTNSEFSF